MEWNGMKSTFSPTMQGTGQLKWAVRSQLQWPAALDCSNQRLPHVIISYHIISHYIISYLPVTQVNPSRGGTGAVTKGSHMGQLRFWNATAAMVLVPPGVFLSLRTLRQWSAVGESQVQCHHSWNLQVGLDGSILHTYFCGDCDIAPD